MRELFQKLFEDDYTKNYAKLIVTIWKIMQNVPYTNSSKFLITEIIVPTASKLQHPTTTPRHAHSWKKSKAWGIFFSTQSSFWMPRIFFKYMILIIEARLPWGVWNLAHENVADLEHLRRRKRRIIIIVMRSCRAADLCHVQPMSFWEKIKGAASIRAQKLTLYVCSLCRLTLLICLKFCVNGGAYVDWPFWSASNFVWMEELM